MIIQTLTQREWNISGERSQTFNRKTLTKILRSLNLMGGGSYFFADYYHKELIVDSADSRVLCGYPKELALTEGLNFFKRILKKDEILWQRRMARKVADIFFSLDVDDRENLMLLYDMHVQLKDKGEHIFHYKIVPFQLCENGNLWLALGCVSSSISSDSGHNVCLVNVLASTRYDLVDKMFVPSAITPITPEETELLQLLVKNMLETDICKLLKINKHKYHRLKKELFKKLEVDTPAGAVQRAHHLGLI